MIFKGGGFGKPTTSKTLKIEAIKHFLSFKLMLRADRFMYSVGKKCYSDMDIHQQRTYDAIVRHDHPNLATRYSK